MEPRDAVIVNPKVMRYQQAFDESTATRVSGESPSYAIPNWHNTARRLSFSKLEVALVIAVAILAILSAVFIAMYFTTDARNVCRRENSPKNNSNEGNNYSTVECSTKQTTPNNSAETSNYGRWRKIGNTCVGAKNDSFGNISYSGSPCFVGAMKLVHKGGRVGCKFGSYSNWGCHFIRDDLISILITDSNNEILYPSGRLVKIDKRAYKLPGYTLLSPRLVFTDFGYPKYLEKGDTLRIWYGEDLSNSTEHNNHGSTCMDVHVYCMTI